MFLKGQLSLEYLALCLIAISLVSISLYALIAIRDLSGDMSERLNFRTTSMRLSNAIGESCAMGSGNRRPAIADLPVSVESEKADTGFLVRIKGGGSSYVFNSRCHVDTAPQLEKGMIIAMNSDGSIRLKGQ